MLTEVALLVVSVAVILAAAELFTNGVEWFGRILNLSEGATGSLLAAVGTAMPETMIPIIAIVFTHDASSDEIGIGAILGAPFMLSTVAFALIGLTCLIGAARGRRPNVLVVNYVVLRRDLGYFVVVYAIALASAFLPWHEAKIAVAVLLIGLYLLYAWQTLQHESEAEGEPNRLHFHRSADVPHTALVVVQMVVALLLMVVGSKIFVTNVEGLAHELGISALVLALLIAPIATELPEKFNSVLWVSRQRDTLALGNVSGAMVFQSCIPVSVGLLFTPWVLEPPALISGLVALTSASMVAASLWLRRVMYPQVLVLGGLLYLLYVGYVLTL